MNGHHISDEDLVLYSIQSLSAGETAAVALHLEECRSVPDNSQRSPATSPCSR